MTSHLVRLTRAVLSLCAIIGVLAGVPLLLSALDLVPTTMPSPHQVMTALGTRDDGQLLQIVLGAVAWVCWFLFTAATVVEVIGQVRARPAPSLPGLSAFQRPAAALVATVLLGLTLTPSASAPVGLARPPLPVAAVGTSTQLHAVSLPSAVLSLVSAAETADVSADLPQYVVQRRDTLWGIAEAHLGDPLRYAEILRLNTGSVGTDNQIVPGTVLALPADALGVGADAGPQSQVAPTRPAEVTVAPGDTLWGLTEAVTGDGHNWPLLWDANGGRMEPDGAVFEDPDVIRPGWTLTVPALGEVPSEPSAPAAVPTATTPPVEVTPTSPAPTAAPPTARPNESVQEEAASSAAQPSTGSSDNHSVVASAASVVGGGALLAGVSLLALTRYRRRQFRHRRPGRRIAGTPPELIPVERSVASADTTDVLWLDKALRSLGCGSSVDGQLPDVVAVSMNENVLSLVLATPSTDAPEPWTVDELGVRWSVARDAQLPYDERQRASSVGPFPTLVSVGTTSGGDHWLLDLERIGALHIGGDPARGRDLLRFMAAELAHNTWSEMLSVRAVGLGTELADLNPDRLILCDDLASAAASVVLSQKARGRAVADGADALTERQGQGQADAWAPDVLLIGLEVGKHDSAWGGLLQEVEQQPARTGIAVVRAAGTDPLDDGAWRVDIDQNGLLRVPALDLQLMAHQLPVEEAAPLAQMLAMAAQVDDQLPPPAPISSAARLDDNPCGGGEPAPAADDAIAVADSLLPLAVSHYLATAATTSEELQLLAPAPAAGGRERATTADPSLDQDLADWSDPATSRPKLTLLGPVSVRAQGSLPQRNPRRQFYTEIVAYLATRTGGATSEQYATALWPDEPDVVGKTKVRQAISVVRAWLGSDPDGVDYLPSGLTAAAGGRYRITDVLIDAELFRRLRVRGTARGTEGIADLQSALDLVEGRPVDLTAPRSGGAGGYGWLIDDGVRLDHEFAAMIVDVAHVVATHHLGVHQPEAAMVAAHVAVRAGSFEDVPLLDLVAAHDQMGNRAEADSHVARILANHDAEVEEDLPPRTAEILYRRQRRP